MEHIDGDCPHFEAFGWCDFCAVETYADKLDALYDAMVEDGLTFGGDYYGTA